MATTRRILFDRRQSSLRRKRLARRGFPLRPSFEPLEARTLLSLAWKTSEVIPGPCLGTPQTAEWAGRGRGARRLPVRRPARWPRPLGPSA